MVYFSRKNFTIVLIFLVIIISLLVFFQKDGGSFIFSSKPTNPYPLFNHTIISYFMDINTVSQNPINEIKYIRGNDGYEEQRVLWALQLVENASSNNLVFIRTDNEEKADVVIKGYFNLSIWASGTLGFADISGVDENNFINQSYVHLFPDVSAYYDVDLSWSSDDCPNFPLVEVHEILHALGFGHVNGDPLSVMLPIEHKIQACDVKEIDEGISNCLTYIYSGGSSGGNCEDYDMFPWENQSQIEDFKWSSLPVTYSTFNCSEQQIENLKKAETLIEREVNYDLYNFIGKNLLASVNFYCFKSPKNLTLNEETDYWDSGIYFPAAQPYFNFIDKNISNITIYLFGEGDSNCGGIEVHEMLHSLGFRTHNSSWTQRETSLCNTRVMVKDPEIIAKIKEVYVL